MSKPTFLVQDGPYSNISYGFDVAPYQPIDVQLEQSILRWEVYGANFGVMQ